MALRNREWHARNDDNDDLPKGHVDSTQIVLITINKWHMDHLRCISFQLPDELQARWAYVTKQ